MEFTPIDPDAVPPVELCPHGLPSGSYCYQCTYVEQPSTQELEPRTIHVVLDIEAEPHWTLDELHANVVGYLTRYIDDGVGYQPETYYIKGVHAVYDGDSASDGDRWEGSSAPV